MPRKKRPEGTRAPNGASTIYLGKDGKWHGRVTMGVRDDGKPDRRHVERKTESEVITAVRKLEKDRDSGKALKAGRAWTVEQWLSHWYETIAAPSVRYKTQTYYRTALDKYLLPGIGAHRLEKLESEHIERLYARLRKEGAKSSTLLQVHRTLRAALNEAERRDRVTRNPIRVVRSPQTDEVEIEPLTVDDVQAVLGESLKRRNGVRWAVALALGFRQGEVLGMKWPDITMAWAHGCPEEKPCNAANPKGCPTSLATGSITVRRALQRQTWQHGCNPESQCGRKRGADCPKRHSGGLVIVEPKSRAGRRVVSLPPTLVPALMLHKEAQDAERANAGNLWRDEGWVFAQPNGKPTDPRADYGEWKDVLAAANVREARLHDARHTAATTLLVLEVPHRAVMDVMGWSKIDMAQRYMHVPDTLRKSIAERVDGVLWKVPERRTETEIETEHGSAGR